jgi:aminoglycoside phosphotransferase (APT) family kinase protein
MPEWDAEVVVDEVLVRALLAEQFPDLDLSSMRLLGDGWDNSVWAVEERWAFRFPRREVAIPGFERELAILPRLAPLLPVRIPEPRFVGAPSERFRWPFYGASLLGGHEPAEASLTDDDRRAVAPELGAFLRVLHSPETLAAVDPRRALPVDFNRRADMSFRVARLRERFPDLPPDLWEPSPAAERILAEAERLPGPRGPLVVAHGDLHIRHVLVDGVAVSGVIDWGDVCLADPSIDLVLMWMLIPRDGREELAAAYGGLDEEMRLRARTLALFLGVILASYARDVGHESLEREAIACLERTLID